MVQFKSINSSPVLPVFLIFFRVDLLLKFLNLNVRLESGLADVETMLMGDCRVPLQYVGAMSAPGAVIYKYKQDSE